MRSYIDENIIDDIQILLFFFINPVESAKELYSKKY